MPFVRAPCELKGAFNQRPVGFATGGHVHDNVARSLHLAILAVLAATWQALLFQLLLEVSQNAPPLGAGMNATYKTAAADDTLPEKNTWFAPRRQ
jgi:hypothetical protein